MKSDFKDALAWPLGEFRRKLEAAHGTGVASGDFSLWVVLVTVNPAGHRAFKGGPNVKVGFDLGRAEAHRQHGARRVGLVRAGAVRQGATAATLAENCGLPVVALTETIGEAADLAAGQGSDPFGRDFTAAPALAPPYFAIKVKGALLHTQGGLRVDTGARVLRPDGTALPNLFAGGGAACGVSGPAVWGYLSGNGLLSAVTLGRIAGRGAAVLVEREGKL